jgi:hypothetical protein
MFYKKCQQEKCLNSVRQKRNTFCSIGCRDDNKRGYSDSCECFDFITTKEFKMCYDCGSKYYYTESKK